MPQGLKLVHGLAQILLPTVIEEERVNELRDFVQRLAYSGDYDPGGNYEVAESIAGYRRHDGNPKCVNAKIEKHAEEGVQSHLDMTVMAVARLNADLSGAVSKVAELKSQMDIQLRKFGRVDELESRVEADHQKNEELAKQIASIKLTHKSKYDRLGKLQKLLAGQADNIETLESTAKKDRKANEDIRRTVDSLHGSTTALAKKVEEMGAIGGTGGRGGGILRGLAQQQISNMKKEMDIQSAQLSEQNLRFQILETASYDGVLMWKINSVRMRKQEADSGKIVSLYSQPFYAGRFGYKMCARIYLNGDGMGKETHVSMFFVVMKGDYDALLKWPFDQKVTMLLLDQDDGKLTLSDSFKPDTRSSSFKRPTGDMNIASRCPLFVSQDILKNSVYVKDDTMFLKMIVDTTGLYV
ncbi:TNF receptor-associated factor 3-like [Anneissia japonica]|uniref:TNF receptor-associated factor 3-like n=1 Tax=Anneissia japonica TaxID=1529436 RepID=UPI001425611C|nr:TNF receptor-associated factor 3-like [Anneissia japonica]